MSAYFSEPRPPGGRVKVELDLSKYATKADLKFSKRFDLARLKSNVDKLDINKLKNVSTNLNNLKS